MTIAPIVSPAVAVCVSAPPAETHELWMYACTSFGEVARADHVAREGERRSRGRRRPSRRETAAESEATIALIAEVDVAVIETAPTLVTLLVSMYAFVCVKTLLNATAPAPLTAPLKPALPAREIEAAAVIASIVESETSKLDPFHVRM